MAEDGKNAWAVGRSEGRMEGRTDGQRQNYIPPLKRGITIVVRYGTLNFVHLQNTPNCFSAGSFQPYF